jgi:poly(ADP-ribose) glycohydrolase ARH3
MPTPRDAGRLRSALLGTALGDAAGAPFEGHRHVPSHAVERWLGSDAPLTWTDDTHMALELAVELARTGGALDPQQLGDRFARAYRSEPWRGYGAGPPQVFAMAEHGVSYVEAAASLFAGAGSFGNGAAMRAAPAGIAAAPSLERAAALATTQARVTHAHPEGIDGARVIATGVAALASADPGTPPADTLGAVLDHLETAALRTPVARILDADGADHRIALAAGGGTGLAARESVPAAIAAFLAATELRPGSITEVLISAVGLGGDTDTVAAMAGALAGAHLGTHGLPDHLLRRLEARDRIEQVADELVQATG